MQLSVLISFLAEFVSELGNDFSEGDGIGPYLRRLHGVVGNVRASRETLKRK